MNKSETLINDLGMRVVKLCIILAIMFFFRFMVTKITVFSRNEFFSTGLSVMHIMVAAVNAVILVFLIKFGFYLEKHYELIRFPKAMTIAKWIVILSSSIIAYKIFYYIARYLFRRDMETYHMIFLCISMLILVRLAVLLFSNMEKITDLFMGKIKIVLREPVASADEGAVEETIPKCSACGRQIEEGISFCPKCGNKVA